MTIYFGGDYNPEQFTADVWAEDIQRMQEANVNLVTVGVFAWSRIQQAEDEYDWEWLDTVLDLLHEAGIGVDLATATATLPPWAITKYPSILPVDHDGAAFWPGTRQHFAPTSPDYRRLADKLVSQLATRYANHPAVRMWHLNNEYGCHVALDYSDHAARAFRRWLRERYGDVQSLNAAWGTSFWSGMITDFDQIYPPRKAPAGRNPSHALDFRRFSSDSLRDLLRREYEIVRAAGATQPITTNFMGAFPHVDYWSWASDVDFVSDDNYPDPSDPESFRAAALTRDLMRSLKPGTPWMLMEQAADAVTWNRTNPSKAPGQMAALSAQAVGRGADGILFFQWRQSTHGAEQFLTAMLPHSGVRTRSWHEVVNLGDRLHNLPRLSTPQGSRVAVVFDWDSWWALESVSFPTALDYLKTITDWYSGLHRGHIDIDFVHPSSDLSRYDLAIAPLLFLLSDTDAENLATFADLGGHLLFVGPSDIVDDNGGVRPGGYQTRLRDVLGVTTLEFNAIAASDEDVSQRSSTFEVHGPELGTIRAHTIVERIIAISADVQVHAELAETHGSGPALTSHASGRGFGYYLATLPDAEGIDRVLSWVLSRVGISSDYDAVDDRIEIMRRGDTLIVVNHSDVARGAALPDGRFIELEAYEWQALPSVQAS